MYVSLHILYSGAPNLSFPCLIKRKSPTYSESVGVIVFPYLQPFQMFIKRAAPVLFHTDALRFHLLQEFDEGKRSCRRRLAGHNRRRRKTHPEATVNATHSNADHSTNYLLISLLRILSNMHCEYPACFFSTVLFFHKKLVCCVISF